LLEQGVLCICYVVSDREQGIVPFHQLHLKDNKTLMADLGVRAD
jgi:hypothetical protein